MGFASIDPTTVIYNLMIAATPILYAASGELLVEKSGVLNLGVEGMMIIGAICGFAISVETGSSYVGFIAAAAGGALLSTIFAIMTQYFLANQVASGLALTLFGLGLAALLGHSWKDVFLSRFFCISFLSISTIDLVFFNKDSTRFNCSSSRGKS